MIIYIILAVVVVFFLLNRLREPDWSKAIPGPPGLPILGNLLQVDPLHPHITYEKWGKQYGGVFKVRLFGSIHVIACDYESIYEVLVTKTTDFAGRVSTFRGRALTQGNKGVAFMDFSPTFTMIKKHCMTGVRLGLGNHGDIEEAAHGCAMDLIRRLRDYGGKAIDIREDLRLAVLHVIITLSFGIKIPDNDPRLTDLSRMEAALIRCVCFEGKGILLDLFPWTRFFGGSIMEDLKECRRIQNSTLAGMVRELKVRRAKGLSTRCIMDPLLDEYDNQKKGSEVIGDTDLLMVAADLIIAGLATTSTMLYHTVNLLLHYPEVQRKVQQEVDDNVPQERPVQLEDRHKMPYCQAVIYETLRQLTNATMAIPHKTTKDTDLRGYFIPKGIMVLNNIWATHHDDTFWKDPYEFRPERFLDEVGNLVGPDHENRKRFFGFSAGRRVCAGESLALIRAFIFFSNMMKYFTFQPDEDSPLVTCDPRSRLFGLGGATRPPDFKVKVVPR